MAGGPGHGILEGGRVHPGVTAQIAAARGRGAPLAPAVRDEMSAALGHDFGDVRVHTDSTAAASATSVHAQAYTVGNDIVFGEGRYAPETDNGRHTIAHELAHVVQQRSGAVDGTPVAGGIALSHPTDRFERAAEMTANRAVPLGGAVQRVGVEFDEELPE